MNELDLIQAMARGEAASPTEFGNSIYFDMRISGTGMADRPARGEVTYRAPEIWTGPEMVRRAQGLPVVLGHPAKAVLDGQEYAARNIGTVVFPYARDGELRGVVRVIDRDAALMLASGGYSTSPAALLRGARIVGDDGVLLIERDPLMLDHLAVVPNHGEVGGGVWDKGGPGAGVRNDIMTEESGKMDEKQEAGVKPEEKTEGGEIMAALKDMAGSIGALADMCKSLGERMDGLEMAGKSAAAADAVSQQAVEPAAGSNPMPTDRPSDKMRAMADEEMAELGKAAMAADSLAAVFGEAAPRAFSCERPMSYRIRVANMYKHHSPTWRGVDLGKMAPDAFAVAEAGIYAEARAAAERPTAPPDMLVERKRQMGAHVVTEFHGRPATWMNQFKHVPLRAKFREFPSR